MSTIKQSVAEEFAEHIPYIVGLLSSSRWRPAWAPLRQTTALSR